jgi:hypothetical protein
VAYAINIVATLPSLVYVYYSSLKGVV